jgi:hypothetical protein
VSIGVFLNDFRFLGDDRRKVIVKYRDTYDARLRSLVEEGKAAGIFRPDANVKLVTVGLLGMVNWVHQWYRPNGRLKPGDIADSFLQTTLLGIVAPVAGQNVARTRATGPKGRPSVATETSAKRAGTTRKRA